MTEKEFFNKVSNSKTDFLQEFINLLKKEKVTFCVIGGLGVNAYTEPVVTMDCDLVIAPSSVNKIIPEIKRHWEIKKFKHSVYVYSKKSDLRIQLQTAPELQKCLKNATEKNVLGYKLPVASIEDIFESKIASALEPERRESKRRKDQSDILRMIEVKKRLLQLFPDELKKELYPKEQK
ncbi:MAG: hypothetical protein AB1349_07680 [Elusimicrobiota bacterium]